MAEQEPDVVGTNGASSGFTPAIDDARPHGPGRRRQQAGPLDHARHAQLPSPSAPAARNDAMRAAS